MTQLNLAFNDSADKNSAIPPYLIEPTSHETYIVKHGTWKGNLIRWTKVGTCSTLSEAIQATRTGAT